MDLKIVLRAKIENLELYYNDVNKIQILNLLFPETIIHLFSIFSFTFSIVKVIIYNLSRNILNVFENGHQR